MYLSGRNRSGPGLAALVISLFIQPNLWAQSGVGIAFNGNGLSSLQYNGTQFLTYGDLRLNQVTFQNSDNSTFAGSTTSTVAVDPVQQTQTRRYSWGAITVSYAPAGARLNMTVAISNTSAATLQQIWFEVLGLGFPSAVQNYDGSDPILGNTVGQPAVVAMNYGSGVLVVAVDSVTKPIQIGFPWAFNKPANTSFPLTINTGSVSSLPNSLPFITRPIPPGGSDQYQFSLRFGPPNSTTETLAPDIYQAFAAAYPPTLNWPDRRPIGQIVIATSAAGYATNPRGFFLNPYIDVTNPAGIASFQQTLLAYANNCIAILKSMNAQGMITWDIEGEQFPTPITYVGDPAQFAVVAPEMAGVADQYFALFRNAGLRVGVTIRPQQFILGPGGTSAQQVPLADPTQTLINKATYAHSRWGATLFYIDSNVNANDPNPIDPNVIRTLSTLFPDSLFIPEHSNTRYFAYSAPYREVKQGYTSTPADARFTYPNSFTVLYTADGPLTADYNALVAAVSQGDVLLYRTWFNDSQNQQVLNIYQAAHPSAGVTISPPAAVLTANQTLQFTSNQQVAWSTTLGTISAAGLYAAPSSITTQQTATVTATSVTDSSKFANASVTLNPTVTISVAPSTGTLTANQTLQFAASVTGSSNQQVSWSTTLGTISATGLYTAPASITAQQTATITATSAADPTRNATASVTLNPTVTISVAPAAGTLIANQTLQFTATVTGSSNQQVTWSTTLGTVSATGLYTAPASITAQQTATITATSAADPTKKATASVTLNPTVTISVAPSTGTLTANQTVQFTASVTGSSNQQVTWSTTLGTVSATGLYTAPASITAQQTATITATSAADPTRSASASVTLNPTVTISVAPSTGTLTANQTVQFTASVTGPSNQQVTWSTTLGTISATGLYTAPASITTQQTAMVTATSAADPTKSATAVVVISPPAMASCGAPAINAFTGCYYQDRSFGTIAFSRVDPQINFNWNASPPASNVGPNNFTVRWQGYFTFSAASYSFTLATDDGSRLWVDGQLIIDDWSEHPAIPYSATVPLPAGSHLIQVDYFQLDGGASASLAWNSIATTLTVSPQTGTLTAGQTLQFTAAVTGSSNQQVTWSLTPAGAGSISGAGLYTAPANIAAQQIVLISASSVADLTKTATASLTINPVISVSVTPATGVLTAGQSAQFAAAVSGSPNQQVTWTTNLGAVSATGIYTAPAILTTQQTAAVTATSAADPAKFATALVTLNPPIVVSVSPQTGTIRAGQTLQFTASVNGSGNQQVTWSASLGTVSGSGLYTAPANVTTQQTAVVTATSAADPTKSASASITLTPPVTVSVSPQTGSLTAGQTLQLTASVSGSINQQVTWGATLGSISTAGFYTAPAYIPSQQAVTITATSVADPAKAAMAVITVNPVVSVAISPQAGSLAAAQTLQFTATVSGTPSLQVTWSATLGSITATGFYTAPASIGTQQTATITATSLSDPTKSAVASVILNPGLSIAVTPLNGVLNSGQTLQFAASITGSANQQVSWTTTLGTISGTGLYTAPSGTSAQQVATVTATSVADPTKSAAARITVNPVIAVSVSPQTGTLTVGQTLQFNAIVTGSANQQVTWTLSPVGFGTISAGGSYTAPSSISAAQIVTVSATSVADPTKASSAIVNLSQPAAPSCGAPSTNSFTGCYYQDRSWSMLGFTRIDPQINFNWNSVLPGPGIGPFNFSVRWQGYFSFTAGSYAFTLATDDGSRLWIDGKLLIDDFGEHPATPVTNSIVMASGVHLLQVDYYQIDGGASASLAWAQQ